MCLCSQAEGGLPARTGLGGDVLGGRDLEDSLVVPEDAALVLLRAEPRERGVRLLECDRAAYPAARGVSQSLLDAPSKAVRLDERLAHHAVRVAAQLAQEVEERIDALESVGDVLVGLRAADGPRAILRSQGAQRVAELL